METVYSRQTQQLYWASWSWNVGLPVALSDRPGIREMAGNAERKTHQEKGGVVSFAKHRATRERSASCFKTPCTIVPTFENWGTRAFALSAIIGIGPEQQDAGLFIQALKDEKFIVRTQGARGLGKIATPAPEAIAALKSSLRDADEGVCKSAYDALQKIDPRSVSDLRPAPAK